MFSANSEPTMTVLDPNLEYLMLTPDPYNYYMIYEISRIHQCQGNLLNQHKLFNHIKLTYTCEV